MTTQTDPRGLTRDAQGRLVLPADGRAGVAAPLWPLPLMSPELVREVADRAAVVSRLETAPTRGQLDEARLARAREEHAVVRAAMRILSQSEAAIWEGMWRTPPAVVWEHFDLVETAAHYTRCQAAAEIGWTTSTSAEARQLAHQLGLTPAGLQCRGWVIETLPAVRSLRAVTP